MPIHPQVLVRRCAVLLGIAFVGALLLGCQEKDEIRTYDVPREPSVPDPTFKAPAGWMKIEPDELSKWAWQVGEGDQSAKVTISNLQGGGGGILRNVNRWRVMQLRLPQINQTQLDQDLKPLKIGDLNAKYVDLTGKYVSTKHDEKPLREDDRILGVILVHDDQTWFFKMRGPPQLVGDHQQEFEEFVQSVRFDGGKP
jgi:hypothetical protein